MTSIKQNLLRQIIEKYIKVQNVPVNLILKWHVASEGSINKEYLFGPHLYSCGCNIKKL